MKSIFWHRRDFRINDNAGLYKALKNNNSVVLVSNDSIFEKLKTSGLNSMPRYIII